MFSPHAYYPLLLSDDVLSLEERIFALQSLPESERDFITSDFVTFSLETAEKKFGISNEATQIITRVIRKFYFKEISRKGVFALLDHEEAFVRHPDRNELYNFIDKNLLSYTIPMGYIERTSGNSNLLTKKKRGIKMSLERALEKYPRISGQRITDADIEFRGSGGPVVPSVKNWITAYHQETGPGPHEPFERSQFLFHNKNALRLSQQERNVLSEVLRSLDEESELPIDTEGQRIDTLQLQNDSQEKRNDSRFTSQDLRGEERKDLGSTIQDLREEDQKISNERFSGTTPYQKETIDDRKDAWNSGNRPIAVPHPSTGGEGRGDSRLTMQDSRVGANTHFSAESAPVVSKEPTFTPQQKDSFAEPAVPASFLRGTGFSAPERDLQKNKDDVQGNKNDSRFTIQDAWGNGKDSRFTIHDLRNNKDDSRFTRNDLRGEGRNDSKLEVQNASMKTALPPRATPKRNNLSRGDRLSQEKDASPIQERFAQNGDKAQNTKYETPKIRKEDYTDYYPIPTVPRNPKMTQIPTESIASGLSFSSSQKFEVEKHDVRGQEDLRDTRYDVRGQEDLRDTRYDVRKEGKREGEKTKNTPLSQTNKPVSQPQNSLAQQQKTQPTQPRRRMIIG